MVLISQCGSLLSSAVIASTAEKLDFGPWEQDFYREFDGRRPKRVLVKIVEE